MYFGWIGHENSVVWKKLRGQQPHLVSVSASSLSGEVLLCGSQLPAAHHSSNIARIANAVPITLLNCPLPPLFKNTPNSNSTSQDVGAFRHVLLSLFVRQTCRCCIAIVAVNFSWFSSTFSTDSSNNEKYVQLAAQNLDDQSAFILCLSSEESGGYKETGRGGYKGIKRREESKEREYAASTRVATRWLQRRGDQWHPQNFSQIFPYQMFIKGSRQKNKCF